MSVHISQVYSIVFKEFTLNIVYLFIFNCFFTVHKKPPRPSNGLSLQSYAHKVMSSKGTANSSPEGVNTELRQRPPPKIPIPPPPATSPPGQDADSRARTAHHWNQKTGDGMRAHPAGTDSRPVVPEEDRAAGARDQRPPAVPPGPPPPPTSLIPPPPPPPPPPDQMSNPSNSLKK